MIPWLAILELVLTTGLLAFLLWIAVMPSIRKELSDQDRAVILENRLTDFLKNPCTSLGKAVLLELPRSVYRFWSGNDIWGIEDVRSYLAKLKAV